MAAPNNSTLLPLLRSSINIGWVSNMVSFRDISPSDVLDKSAHRALDSSHLPSLGDVTRALCSAADSAVSRSTFAVLRWIGLDISNPSPITKDLPFISSPTPVIASVLAYLLAVFLWSNHIRASGLKPRTQDPAAIRLLVIVHNLFLCALSFFMGSGMVVEAWRNGWTIWGNQVRETDYEMGYLIYIFYISKIYEFMDTAIMLLRRNLRQVSYLHVYHHSSISVIWWIISYVCPGGDAYFSAAFNSWIHVIMYLYYLLSSTIAKEERLRKKYLFWGKYLTMLQIIQFVSFIAQSVYGMFYPELYPKGISNLLFFYSLSLLLFFGNFFLKKYSRKDNREKVKTN